MQKRALALALLVVGLETQAHSAPFYGTFVCDFVKITPTPQDGGGFQTGDQIFVGVTEHRISWMSHHGRGQTYNCSRTGSVLICPLGDTADYVALDQKQPNSVFDIERKTFIRAVAIFQEEWKCTRFHLGYTGTVYPSDPE